MPWFCQATTGHYGRHLTAAVIGFGNTARGAITALQSLGVHDITVLTMRDLTAVASPIPGLVMGHLRPASTTTRPRTVILDEDADCRPRSSWRRTTSSSTASCRTPTIR